MNAELLHALGAEELPRYRQRTLGLLHRYFHTSLEVGRLPSLLGREFFRSKVSSYSVTTFEDAVIFVHDIERCLAQLDFEAQRLIAKMVFQNYGYQEAARMLNCTWRTVARRFPAALDDLSRIFLRVGMLAPFFCQGVKKSKPGLSACKQSK